MPVGSALNDCARLRFTRLLGRVLLQAPTAGWVRVGGLGNAAHTVFGAAFRAMDRPALFSAALLSSA